MTNEVKMEIQKAILNGFHAESVAIVEEISSTELILEVKTSTTKTRHKVVLNEGSASFSCTQVKG